MSTFTLALFCFTTSNLPWFMDLTFQVPMQYCSLQHRTLLLSPVTSVAGYSFCFGSIPSFFLELFLHWSPVAYWAPTDLGSFSFNRSNKISSNLKDTIKTLQQLDLIYICITLHQRAKEYSLFLSGHRTLIKIGPILSHGQVTEII